MPNVNYEFISASIRYHKDEIPIKGGKDNGDLMFYTGEFKNPQQLGLAYITECEGYIYNNHSGEYGLVLGGTIPATSGVVYPGGLKEELNICGQTLVSETRKNNLISNEEMNQDLVIIKLAGSQVIVETEKTIKTYNIH